MRLHQALQVVMLTASTSAFSSGRLFAGRISKQTFLAMSTAIANPFLEQETTPKFSKLEPQFLTPAVDVLLEDMKTQFEQLEKKLDEDFKEADYDAVLPEVEKIRSPLEYAWGVAGHLNGVKNGDELRAAYEASQPKVVQSFTAFAQSKPLYDALVKLQESWSDDDAISFKERQQRRAIEGSLRAMKLGGVGLEGAEKERFNEIRLRLAELSTNFSNNILDETKAFSLTVDSADAAKLDGAPASAMAMWAQSHEQYLKKEGNDDAKIDPETGPWRITLDGPSYIATLSHVPDREIREQIYRAYITRASEGNAEKNNVPIINEILKLKTESAKMLGYANYAEQSLASKMAPTVESVAELTDLIAAKAGPAAYTELEEITTYARSKGGDEYAEDKLAKLMPWDVTFWSERFKEEKYAVTEEELRPYFALPAVLDGMFELVKRIFGVVVKPADGEAEVWNEDVRYFNVYDVDTNVHIASFFLDPYSRPADKRGGAWMDVCIQKSEAMKRDIPVAYLTCNGSPPVGDKPSLMTFREVETLFHEFGHGLQHMLTEAEVGDVSGINGVEWDAVELPSQFMENWCYDKPTVYGFAKHYETGEPLPEDLFEKLKQQKTFSAGLMAMRQLYFGSLDMELHSAYDPEGEETIFDVQKRIAAKYQPHNLPLPEDRFLCTFGHIFGGGYAAGYYSYKWAEVMSADAFGAFEDVGLDNDEEVKKVGRSFRKTVLALGGGIPPSEVFKSFRGRDPTPDALLRHNGLA